MKRLLDVMWVVRFLAIFTSIHVISHSDLVDEHKRQASFEHLWHARTSPTRISCLVRFKSRLSDYFCTQSLIFHN